MTEILSHLGEVERRRLFAQQGFPSLFEYCIKSLGYSPGAAFRRISAMRLLKEIPETEAALKEGTLNLSQVTVAQGFFKRGEKSGKILPLVEKRQILTSLQGKSSRECDRFFARLSPEVLPPEREWVLTENHTEIRLVVNEQVMQKMRRFKELHARVNPDPGYAELLETLLDLALRKKDPLQKSVLQNALLKMPSLPAPEVKVEPGNRRPAIPAATRRMIWHRDQGRCTYKNPETGLQCDSRHQLEVDHIHPIGKGGDSSPRNLRLLCRQHNLWHAVKEFGEIKMNQWLSAR